MIRFSAFIDLCLKLQIGLDEVVFRIFQRANETMTPKVLPTNSVKTCTPMNDESLFELVLQTPESERSSLIAAQCAGDPEKLARIRSMINEHFVRETVDGPTELPPQGSVDATQDSSLDFHVVEQPEHADPETVGTVVAGRYQLLKPVGEGGMGTVWLANQTQPVKRRVAVKLIRVDRGTCKTIVSRFEAERQAIALMDHPNIAKLLDAGTTNSGAPFFVMELVNGIPLNEYCDVHRLSIPGRLSLFSIICDAVQHAHQKGIIHRDLKPSNILIEHNEGKPVPKIIDFGLAKATSGLPLTENTLFTGFGAVLGTPLYMAPEQADLNALDIDTRADIYSLGVILYELLTGTTPLTRETIRQAAIDALLKLIREEDPPTPSSRLSSSEAAPSIAANRRIEPSKLSRLVKGELDWIVLKALSKDRERRYGTANGFARDIDRFLNHEPVQAGPPSVSYKLQKFVRRNRGMVFASSMVAAAIVVGVMGTSWGMLEARNQTVIAQKNEKVAKAERARALAAAENEKNARLIEEQERKYAEAIANFVKNDLLALTSVEGQMRFAAPDETPEQLSKDSTLRELLERAARKLEDQKHLSPRTQADLHWIIGVSLRNVGEASRAISHLETCVAIRKDNLGDNAPETLRAMNSLSAAITASGDPERSIPLEEDIVRRRRELLGSEHRSTLFSMCNLAANYVNIGRFDLAIPLLEETLEIQKRTLGTGEPETLLTMKNLANAYLNDGQIERSLPILEETFNKWKALEGSGNTNTLSTMSLLATAYSKAKRFEDAMPLLKKSLALTKQILGHEHPQTWACVSRLASTHMSLGQTEEALPLLVQTLEYRQRELGSEHPSTLASMNSLAKIYWQTEQFEKSVPMYEQLLPKVEGLLGRQHPNTQSTIANLGINYRDSGNIKSSIPLLKEVWQGSEDRPRFQWVGRDLLESYLLADMNSEADKLTNELVQNARQEHEAGSQELANAMLNYGAIHLTRLNSPNQAEPLLRESDTIFKKQETQEWNAYIVRAMLGEALRRQEKHENAEPILLQAYEGLQSTEPESPDDKNHRIRETLESLSKLYAETDRPAEARKFKDLLDKCLD